MISTRTLQIRFHSTRKKSNEVAKHKNNANVLAKHKNIANVDAKEENDGKGGR